jgi:hypothetical protein
MQHIQKKLLLGILQESLLPADVINDGFAQGVKKFQGGPKNADIKK